MKIENTVEGTDYVATVVADCDAENVKWHLHVYKLNNGTVSLEDYNEQWTVKACTRPGKPLTPCLVTPTNYSRWLSFTLLRHR